MSYKLCFGLSMVALSFLMNCKSPSEPELVDTNSKIPALNSPADGTKLENPDLLFKWNDATSANRYKISIDDADTFLNPEITQETPDNNYTPTEELSLGTYYWRVQARGADNKWGEWSPVWNFTIVQSATPPPTPELVAPRNKLSTNFQTPLFSWKPVTDAVKYELVVDNDDDFNSPIINELNISKTEYTPQASIPLGSYYWKLRAVNTADKKSDWTSKRTFTVREPYEYEQIIPGVWKATYVDGYYTVSSEYMFTESGTITYNSVYESHAYDDYTILAAGTYQMDKINDNYYVNYSYTKWDVPSNIRFYQNDGMQIKFNSEGQLEMLIYLARNREWITYSRL